MKVFLDTTYRRDKQHHANYLQIYNRIEALGHVHLFKDIAQDSPLSINETSDKRERNKSVDLYRKRLEYLHRSDINVFEASIPSLSTGLLIEKSIEMNKPTIVFYQQSNIPTLISGIENDKLILASYDEDNLDKVVQDTFIKAGQIRDKRFNFFISPSLLEYLDRKSKEMGITKSTFIRGLILKHMKNN